MSSRIVFILGMTVCQVVWNEMEYEVQAKGSVLRPESSFSTPGSISKAAVTRAHFGHFLPILAFFCQYR